MSRNEKQQTKISGDMVEGGLSPDYVIWTPGQKLQLLDVPINVYFGLGHIYRLSVTFNQQIPDQQNTAGLIFVFKCLHFITHRATSLQLTYNF